MHGSLLPFSVVSAGVSICSYALFFLGDRVKWDGIIISSVSFFCVLSLSTICVEISTLFKKEL